MRDRGLVSVTDSKEHIFGNKSQVRKEVPTCDFAFEKRPQKTHPFDLVRRVGLCSHGVQVRLTTMYSTSIHVYNSVVRDRDKIYRDWLLYGDQPHLTNN